MPAETLLIPKYSCRGKVVHKIGAITKNVFCPMKLMRRATYNRPSLNDQVRWADFNL